MRASVVVAVLMVGAVAACSGSPSAKVSEAGPSSPSSSSASSASTAGGATPVTEPQGVVPNLEALQTVTAYPKAVAAAARARNVNATKAIQTGSLLAISLADYRYTKKVGLKPIRPVALTEPGVVIPAAGDKRTWFLSTAYSEAGQSNYVSLFERARPGDRWRKSMQIWLGDSSFPDPTASASGVATLADAHSAALDAAGLRALAGYLATGKRAKQLRSAGPARYVRSYFTTSIKHVSGANGKVSCATTPGTSTAALATASGSVALASLSCTLTETARPGWRLFLKDQWKGLAAKNSNLRSFSVRFATQVALSVARSGSVSVIGTSWGLTGITTR